MHNKIVTLVLLILILPVMAFGQNRKNTKHIPKAPVVGSLTEKSTMSTTAFSPESMLPDGNYVLVDSMANAFGPASGPLNPMAFDPYSGTIAFVHRGAAGYATGSGEIWYNVSTDFGLTWQRVAQAVNSQSTNKAGRYPSMWISNPTKGNLDATTALFSFPNLSPTTATFGWLTYGADFPAGSGTTISSDDQGSPDQFSSQIPCWSSDVTGTMFWYSDLMADQPGGAGIKLFSTTDFVTVDQRFPPQWSDSVWSEDPTVDGGNIGLGGVSHNGVQYVGFLGTPNYWYTGDTVGMVSGWYICYSKSTDDGATWSDLKVIDWRSTSSTPIPRLEKYDRLYDYKKGDAFVSYQGDIHVDQYNKVHFCVQLTDTLLDSDDGINAVVDIFETDSTASGWDGIVVYEGLNNDAYLMGPGLAQMGPASWISMDSTNAVIGYQWINSGPQDPMIADVYFAYRTIKDTAFSAPVNLTNSPNINNTQAHLAPFMRTTKAGDMLDVEAYSMYGYVKGVELPYGDTTKVTNIYAAKVPFQVIDPNIVGIHDNYVVNNFNLSQNYPNPFNPSTKINFTLAERSNISLKVYDLLGREVANLISGDKGAGSYSIPFNGSNLASGLYIYTLKAGSNSISKKMMLMK